MSQGGRLGVVFDCNIFFQATRNAAGPAAELLRRLEAGAFSLYLSDTILEEVRETLNDPTVRARNRSITDAAVDALLGHLSAKAAFVQDVPERFTLERDPDDAKYVNLALAAGARYLVTRDKDLLDLMNDSAFRSQYTDLTILDPVAFLQWLPPKDARSPEAPG
jgi:putative PIN family toxin of toxin-antitoxin system